MIHIRRILVLCEGNHCRSPLAEALLQSAMAPGVQVTSAGLDALLGHPPHEESLRLGADLGLDLSAHRGRQFTPELALNADLILVMDRAQQEACHRLAPSSRGRVFLLGRWLPEAEQEIADPIHQPVAAHEHSCAHLRRAVALWVPRLAPPSPRNP